MAATTFQSDETPKSPSSHSHPIIPPLQSDPSTDDSDNASKKPVWNKPSNPPVSHAVTPVIDALSWPALTPVTNNNNNNNNNNNKSSPKSSSSDSLKTLTDSPFPPPLQLGTENISANSPRKQTNANNKRSMKRGGGGGSFNKNVAVTGPESENATGKEGESMKGGVGVQSNNGNERQNQRHAYRRSNSGPHSRGDGSYHHGYGGKRDQDREWNQHSRSFNGRDAHTQRGYPRGGYVRPAVHAPPPTFIPPQMPMLRPFGNNMMYPEMPSPMFYYQGPPPPPAESLRGMAPVVGPPIPPPMYFVSDPMLYARIVAQIDYYFSNDNLVKDTYLRKNMDEQGWVPVSLIAGFKKVLYLTDNIQLILDAMRASTIVEVQGDKIRRRNDWMKWLMQPPAQAGENQDVLASQLQGVSLDDATSTVQDSVH